MRPLSELRVVDMADEKGEICGRLLADLRRPLPPPPAFARGARFRSWRNASAAGLGAARGGPR